MFSFQNDYSEGVTSHDATGACLAITSGYYLLLWILKSSQRLMGLKSDYGCCVSSNSRIILESSVPKTGF